MKITKSKLKHIIQEEKNWIQRVDKEIKKDGTKGVCTGKKFGGPTCRPGTPRYNLAKTFRNMNEEYAGEEYDEGHADSYNYGDTAPRKDSPEYLKGFEAGIRQKEEESGDDYYDIRKSDLGPDRLEEDEWPDKVKKGRFTSYCKREGFDGPGIGCAEKAMDSDDASVRGMASFYMNTVKPRGKDASDVAEELTKESLSKMIKQVIKEASWGTAHYPPKRNKKHAAWMKKFKDLVDASEYDRSKDPGFWDAASFYKTKNFSPEDAAARYIDSGLKPA